MNRILCSAALLAKLSVLVILTGCCAAAPDKSLPVSKSPTDPVRWQENGHWYQAVLVGKQGISWTAAQAAAKARGGYLATITSAAENEFVFSLIAENSDIWEKGKGVNWDGPWLGGYQKDKLDEPAGHWAWVTGEPWGYTNWSPGEPNNYGGMEDYLRFLAPGGKIASVWNDCPVNSYPERDQHVLGYIIEWNERPSK